MAQTNFTPIQLYYSTTGAAAPTAGNLANGELAINITDGKLFYKDNLGVVQVLATKAGASGDVVGPGSSTDNALVRFDTTTGKLVQNSVGILDDSGNLTGLAAVTMSGALTLSGGTANGVAYLNGSKVLTTGSALTFDGAGNLTLGGATPRLLSNMSGTLSTRFIIQNSTTNGNSRVYLYPNGTGNISAINGVNNSDVAATDYQAFDLAVVGTTDVRLSSSANGAAAFLPLTFYTNGSEQMRLTSTGLGIGTSSPAVSLQSGDGTQASREIRTSTLAGAGQGGFLRGFRGGNASFYVGDSAPISGGSAGGLTLFSYGATSVDTYTNGILRSTLDSSGNLGLGVTPSAVSASDRVLQVRSFLFNDNTNGYGILRYNNFFNGTNDVYLNTGAVSAFQMQGNSFKWYQAGSGTAGNAITFTQAMTLDASGRLLVGQTSTGLQNSRSFTWQGSGEGSFYVSHSTSDGNGDPFMRFGYNATQIGSITQNGTTGVLYNTSSDYRLKNITGPITTSGAYIDSLNPVEGTWKADGSTFVGLIAHEAQEASRTPVATGEKDGEQMQGMDYSSAEIIGNMIAELKSLRARVAALESN